MATDNLTEQINVRFSRDEYKELERMAATADRTPTYVVRKIVRTELKKMGKKELDL